MDRQPLPGACVSHTQQASNEEQGLYPRLSVSFFQVRRMEDLGDRRKVESLRAKCETVLLALYSVLRLQTSHRPCTNFGDKD